MKHIYTSLLVVLSLSLQAQVEDYVVSMQGDYANQVFFDMETGDVSSISQDSWDIAFDLSADGTGIVFNEGETRSASTPRIRAFLVGSDFDATTSAPTDDQEILNDEKSWSEGAFNLVADDTDPLDVGWGMLDEATQTVTGTRVFIIQLRDNSYKKIEFTSLSGGVFSGRHANLDGTGETSFSVDKTAYPGKRLAYYKISTDEVLDLEPAEWDLKFTRYYQFADQFGQPQQYPFTGILHNDATVDVAEARNVDIDNVDFNDFAEDFSDEIDIIGADWKFLESFLIGFEIEEDLCYFVRSLDDGTVYKLIFDDFTGSDLGETTLTLENVGTLSATSELPSSLSSAFIFPNPAFDQADLRIELNRALPNNGEAQLAIFDQLGRLLTNEQVELRPGVNQFDLPVASLTSGHYLVRLNWGTEHYTQSLFVR
ncbi:MAG: HmuY family protein [Bacteroidota bacterium]